MKIESLCKPADEFSLKELVWLICSPQFASTSWARKYILSWVFSVNGWHHPFALAKKYTWWNRFSRKFDSVDYYHLRFYQQMLWAIEMCTERHIPDLLEWTEEKLLKRIEVALIYRAQDLSVAQKVEKQLKEALHLDGAEEELQSLSSRIKDNRGTIIEIHSLLRHTKLVKSNIAYYFLKAGELKRTPTQQKKDWDNLVAQHEEANRPEVVDARIIDPVDQGVENPK